MFKKGIGENHIKQVEIADFSATFLNSNKALLVRSERAIYFIKTS